MATYPTVLTKENFWNDLHEKYPKSMKKFCDWIDVYKKRENWDVMFGKYRKDTGNSEWRSPKFHEIPIAMQIGIFIQFTMECGRFEDYSQFFMTGRMPTQMWILIDMIRDWFRTEEYLLDGTTA